MWTTARTTHSVFPAFDFEVSTRTDLRVRASLVRVRNAQSAAHRQASGKKVFRRAMARRARNVILPDRETMKTQMKR